MSFLTSVELVFSLVLSSNWFRFSTGSLEEISIYREMRDRPSNGKVY